MSVYVEYGSIWQSLSTFTGKLPTIDLVAVTVTASTPSVDLPGWLLANLPSVDTYLASVEWRSQDITMVSTQLSPGRVQRVSTEGRVEV